MRGRLFEGLQEGVPRALREHVHFVEDVHLVGRLEGQRIDALGERADVVDAVVARGVDLGEVLRRAADRAREDARDARLPEAAAAGEEVGVADAAARRLGERRGDVFLPDDLAERRRPVGAVERVMCHVRPV